MRTVDKALRLLNLFSIAAPEHGLSALARLAGYDKATTLRMLTSLERHGLLEQHPQTKKYRLGKSLLRLARVRETSFPVTSVIEPVLERLAAATGETAHAALSSGRELITIAVAEPPRTMRVHINPSEPLPYHATASGIALLAYGDDALLQEAVAQKLTAYTPHTIVTADELRRQVADTRRRGYAVCLRGFDAEVIGIAAPVFERPGRAYGTIAVASVAARLTAGKRRQVAQAVLAAAIEVTHAMGGEPDASLLRHGKELIA